MSALTNQDWMFDSLLEGAPLLTIRICRLYEYAREVTIWTENSISLGQHAMMMKMMMVHPERYSPLYGFCITKPGGSRDWLRVPYFKLSSRIRDDLYKLYDSHLSALIDPSHPLHDLPFLPVGPLGTHASQRMELDLPLAASNQFRRECFDALLRQRFASQEEEDSADEGGKAEIRLLKNDLRHLGALRLVRHMSAREAIRYTVRKSGQALYANPSGWSRAKREAAKNIESFFINASSLSGHGFGPDYSQPNLITQ